MCRVKYECRAGIEVLARANGGESHKLSADVDAVRTRMVVSADDELHLVLALVLNYFKDFISVVYDMSFLNADIEALMAKDPESASLGRIYKNLSESLDLIRGNIGVLPIVLDTAAVARAVGRIIGIKENDIDLIRAANEGRADEIGDAVKCIVIKIFEIVIALHNEDGHRAVTNDLRHARKMLDIVRAADATVYNVAKTDSKINAYIFKIKKKLLQLAERTRGESVAVRDLFSAAVKVGKESNFHIFSPCVDRI